MRVFGSVFGSSVEEKQILEKKAEIDATTGETSTELSPVDIGSGVYPKSYFDLEKYPTHWKIVHI